LRALIYNRVSSDPSGRRVSVESQDTENHAFCERQGWTVAATVTDNDRSASRYAVKERDGYQQVRTALSGGRWGRIDVLVAWESSRAQRDLADYVQLRDLCSLHNVLFAYRGRVYDLSEGDDRFTTGLDALVDEREAERIRSRTLRGHRVSVEKGTPRGVTPYGYRREYNEHTGRMVAQVPDPDTSPVVKDIVSRILRGDTLYAIAQDLNGRGVLTPRGHLDVRQGRVPDRAGWSSSMIRNMLGKHSLMGVRAHLGVASGSGTWKPIVAPADWAEVQKILGDPRRARNPRGVKVRFLLSGIATCGVCGAWMRPLTNRGRPTYACAGVTPTSPKGHVSRSRPALDALVTARVVQRLADPGLLAGFARARAADDNQAAAVAQELADLHAQLAEYEHAALTAKGVQAASFARVTAGLSERIEDAQSRMVSAQSLPPAVLDLVGPDAAQRWANIQNDLLRQRQVVRALARVVVHRSSQPRGVHGFDASSIELIDL
jgi:site-specific DNA recombinase